MKDKTSMTIPKLNETEFFVLNNMSDLKIVIVDFM